MGAILAIIFGFALSLYCIYELIFVLIEQPADALLFIIFRVVFIIGGIGIIWASIEMKRLENANRRWHN